MGKQLERTLLDNPDDLINFYAQAKSLEDKREVISLVGGFYKERGLFALLDYLYLQQIGSESIRVILDKHSLLADINLLEPAECDMIASVMMDYLETPGPVISNSDEELKFKVDIINRKSAARILVVLNRHPNTSGKSKLRIRRRSKLIVTFECVDRMVDGFSEVLLNRYLDGHIR